MNAAMSKMKQLLEIALHCECNMLLSLCAYCIMFAMYIFCALKVIKNGFPFFVSIVL